jgi:rSAM/selenodomain-associated transferase 1
VFILIVGPVAFQAAHRIAAAVNDFFAQIIIPIDIPSHTQKFRAAYWDVNWGIALPVARVMIEALLMAAICDPHLLIVFVKAPRPGAVKTRLAADIGEDAACEAYKIMLQTVLERVSLLRNVQLRFSPDDAGSEMKPWTRTGWSVAPQGGGDLGERLRRAFSDAFAAGMERVAIIGSDCLDLTMADVEQAWAALDESDVVLGPALDGGYWIIGLRNVVPSLLEEIPWGTETVLKKTLRVAEKAGLRVRLLRELRDIDTSEDWRAYLAGNSFASSAPVR